MVSLTTQFFLVKRTWNDQLTLTPLVDQQRWRFCVSRFDPGREKAPLVGLVPQVLVQVGVGDLLQRFHIVHRHQVAVQVHELDTHLERKSKSTEAVYKKADSIVQPLVMNRRESGGDVIQKMINAPL